MNLSDFDFDLPEELIALRPVRPRPAARMLVAQGDNISDQHFADLPNFLREGDRLVLNRTKVLPARLRGKRRRISDQGETFASVEITLMQPHADGEWLTLAKPARRLKVGETIQFEHDLAAEVLDKSSDGVLVRFSAQGDALDQAIAAQGEMPLPPYIAGKRDTDAQDLDDYQTVFARDVGAVAAPTASLHFDDGLLDRLRSQGVGLTDVTLHVGAGTFLPVKTDNIDDHKMHSEWGEVRAQAAQEILETRKNGGRVIAVGTTALRLIETAAREAGQIKPWVGDTDIFIKPGFDFKAADGLITNFHLPKSTLMMLVSAMMGTDRIKAIYAHAIADQYRFFSYGDGSLLLPE